MKKIALIMVVLMLSSTAAYGFTFLSGDVTANGTGSEIYGDNSVPFNSDYFSGTGAVPPLGELEGTSLTDLATFIKVVDITPPDEPTTSGVPEPTTMALFALGLLGAGILRRKTL